MANSNLRWNPVSAPQSTNQSNFNVHKEAGKLFSETLGGLSKMVKEQDDKAHEVANSAFTAALTNATDVDTLNKLEQGGFAALPNSNLLKADKIAIGFREKRKALEQDALAKQALEDSALARGDRLTDRTKRLKNEADTLKFREFLKTNKTALNPDGTLNQAVLDKFTLDNNIQPQVQSSVYAESNAANNFNAAQLKKTEAARLDKAMRMSTVVNPSTGKEEINPFLLDKNMKANKFTSEDTLKQVDLMDKVQSQGGIIQAREKAKQDKVITNQLKTARDNMNRITDPFEKNEMGILVDQLEAAYTDPEKAVYQKALGGKEGLKKWVGVLERASNKSSGIQNFFNNEFVESDEIAALRDIFNNAPVTTRRFKPTDITPFGAADYLSTKAKEAFKRANTNTK